MDVTISKKDILWGYVAQFFNLGAGFITLPIVLNRLSTEEIALNYLFITVGTMVALLDFGFAPQFGRNITYVFSGANELKKEGLSDNVGDEINYHLLYCLIKVAKKVYKYMSIIALMLLLTFGTIYVYKITKGFTVVDNILLIWIIFCISIFFGMYFNYLSSLLSGRGLQMEQKKAMMGSRITSILLTYVLLLNGMGLIGVCFSNLISPFVSRWLSLKYFYDDDLKTKLANESASDSEIKELSSVVWYNAKKLGINFVGGYCITQFGIFISGVYLTLSEVSSYGLMLQLVSILSAVSTTYLVTMFPQITSLRVKGDKFLLIKKLSSSFFIYYVLFGTGALLLVLLGPLVLRLIGSNAELPSNTILLIFLFSTLLENNHSQCGTYIASGNNIPFIKSALGSGSLICTGDLLILHFTNLGVLGVVLVQTIVQLGYNNWYWPKWVLNELELSMLDFLKIGFSESRLLLKGFIRSVKL